jgi:hypothetical protein
MRTDGRVVVRRWVVAWLLVVSAGVGRAAVHYVKADAAGAGSGTSWADAYVDLRTALGAAGSGDEIWVAAGTYKPTSGTVRSISFAMVKGVGMYGGFVGGETTREERDWEANETILSGDIGTSGTATDNTYHVVLGADDAVLDGFTIARGYAFAQEIARGGGMLNISVSPTVANCTFTRNTALATNSVPDASAYGGGIYNENASPTITNCTFAYNLAAAVCTSVIDVNYNSGRGFGYGGGVASSGGTITISNCTFANNIAKGTYGGRPSEHNSSAVGIGSGGGIYSSNADLSVDNCHIHENTAHGASDTNGRILTHGYASGGGMSVSGGAAIITNTTIENNRALGTFDTTGAYSFPGTGILRASGGGVRCSDVAVTVKNCIIVGNSGLTKHDATSRSGGGEGGGMAAFSSSGSIQDSIFTKNSLTDLNYSAGGGFYNSSGNLKIDHCVFSDNATVGGSGFGKGGGMYGGGRGTTIANCMFTGNFASAPTTATSYGAGGGGLYNVGGSTITGCIFTGNTATGSILVYGGGFFNDTLGDYIGNPTITDCLFNSNSASGSGGGLFRADAINCVFVNNSAGYAGGGLLDGSAVNCTFTSNTAGYAGGGGYVSIDNQEFVNCIMLNNDAPLAGQTRADGGWLVLRNCNLQGSRGSGAGWNGLLGGDGGGNIDADPMFVDAGNPAGADGVWGTEDDGLRLMYGSPCIDAGTAAGAPLDDILGNPRDGKPDIGAYELWRAGAREWLFYR